MSKILVLGIGPGSPAYLLPVVYQAAQSCQVLAGGQRQLELFKELGKEELQLGGSLEELIKTLRETCLKKRVGVLVSGDPGLYSLLNTLLQHFSREELEVYPGISSLQYLFAKGALPWQDAAIISLHGRRREELAELIRTNRKVALLTDRKFPVGEIARCLVSRGVAGKRALVGENLSYPEEKIQDRPLAGWVDTPVADLCVMVIYDE